MAPKFTHRKTHRYTKWFFPLTKREENKLIGKFNKSPKNLATEIQSHLANNHKKKFGNNLWKFGNFFGLLFLFGA